MSSKRKQTERNQQILKQLLREPCNRYCCDCKTAKNPRWASWNLGVFICIRCSGIHRSMGTHISRVKSVDLDSWTDEQVKSMVMWGNAKANAYWEAKLPDGYVPNESKIENFIRTKYDLKKWSSGGTPDPARIQVDSKQTTPLAASSSVSSSVSSGPSSAAASSTSLLDLGIDLSTPAQPRRQPAVLQQTAAQQQKSSSMSLLDSSITEQKARQAPTASINSGSAAAKANSRPELKKSILSLYSSPSPSPASSTQSLPQQQQQQQQPHTYTSTVSGGNANYGYNQTMGVTQSNGVQAAWSSSNVWASTSSANSSNSSAKKAAADDDVFKNIWK